MFAIIADGIDWEDSDGATEWTWAEAATLADMLEGNGYDVTIVQTSRE